MITPRIIQFNGAAIDASKVVAVDPVGGHKTGSAACDWSYGFVVRLTGNSVTILHYSPRYGYCGGPTREQYKAEVEKMRAEFMRLVWPEGKV